VALFVIICAAAAVKDEMPRAIETIENKLLLTDPPIALQLLDATIRGVQKHAKIGVSDIVKSLEALRADFELD
jgi:hypothetical protein